MQITLQVRVFITVLSVEQEWMNNKLYISLTTEELIELLCAVSSRMKENKEALKDHDDVSNILRPIFIRRMSIDSELIKELNRCLTK